LGKFGGQFCLKSDCLFAMEPLKTSRLSARLESRKRSRHTINRRVIAAMRVAEIAKIGALQTLVCSVGFYHADPRSLTPQLSEGE
jgi:hypothetical protein